MSARSHYLEAEGLSTTGVSLVREHSQAMAPPRALWVPFPLGRPLDVAGEPWSCSVRFARAATEQDLAGAARTELAGLAIWHELARRRRRRAIAGTSGLAIEQCLELVIDASRTGGTDDVRRLKAAVEDLKWHYVEAATARPGAPPAGAIDETLLNESALGRLLRRLALRGANSGDAAMRFFAKDSLVPRQLR